MVEFRSYEARRQGAGTCLELLHAAFTFKHVAQGPEEELVGFVEHGEAAPSQSAPDRRKLKAVPYGTWDHSEGELPNGVLRVASGSCFGTH